MTDPIDDPERIRSAAAGLLARALTDARERTLQLLAALREALGDKLEVPCAAKVNPPLWSWATSAGEKMRTELEMAQRVQVSTLPATMPAPAGYDAFGISQPAEDTGGDTVVLLKREAVQ